MATFDYKQARLDAESLIKEFGAAGQVILKGSTGGYDEHGNIEPDTDGVIINGIITPLIGYKTTEIDGESIQHGDNYVLFHSEGVPKINMTVSMGGNTFRVIGVYALCSVGGVNVLTKLQLRK